MIAVVLAVVTTACASERQLRPSGVQTEARRAYLSGLVELQEGNYQEALRQFNEVAASPRYFRFTALASLRVGDTLFYQQQYAQAVTAYQGFIKRFAGDPNIPYAEFRIAQSFFRRIPDDWWFMPPAYEKDLSTTRSAYQALTRFVERYERHEFAPRAVEMRAFCAKRLYENELYVARFYEKRDRPLGVVQRLEGALEQFPELAVREDNFLWLARAYVNAGDPAGARATLVRYLSAFPEGEHAEEVRASLLELSSEEAAPTDDDDEAPPAEGPDAD